MRQSVTTDFAAYLLEGKAPDHLAMLTLTGQHTYGEIYRGTESVASWLRENDVRKGDRVLLLADNSLFWVAAYLGTIHAGCVVVPLAPTISAGELEYVVAVAEPRCAFVQPRYAGQKATSLAGVRVLTELPDTCCASDQSNHLQHSSLGLDDLAALMFTSGSTGKPRGVMVTHGNLIANTESIVEYLELSKEDRILAVLPFHYCFGASLLHTHLRVGGSIVVEPRFMFLESTLQRMKATECTGFAGVPSHYQILLRKSNIRQTEFPRLRYAQQAGGHLAPAFVQELRAALPRTKIYIMYGQTEATARLAYLPPDLLTEKFGSIGKAIPGVALEVLDEAGQSVKPGQVGEIVAEGANVTKGYWHDEEASLVSFRNGRLYTGDLATVDEDGFIYVVDRARDFLKCGGKRVSCRQIESTILEFQELQEAAVIGLPDPVLGEAVKAFVVPCDIKARDIPERLLAFCRTRLPAPFVPKEIVVMASLPKNTAGKILKPLLAQASVSK